MQKIICDPCLSPTNTHKQYTSTKTCQGCIDKYTVSCINHSCPARLHLQPPRPRYLALPGSLKIWTFKGSGSIVSKCLHSVCNRTTTGNTLSSTNAKVWTAQAAGQTLAKNNTHVYLSLLSGSPQLHRGRLETSVQGRRKVTFLLRSESIFARGERCVWIAPTSVFI